ncbi:hypothetical protein FRB99_000635 [Tulasnella sp. 403]|nr:hypothetical protein FRB99_000635 [Tulasnella sp. 403]
MPPKPTVSSRTNNWKKYYVCKRHIQKSTRKLRTDNHIRTFGTCPCFVTCLGEVHPDESWNICVDKHGHGRCDHPECNRFYLNGRCGFIDETDGRCYWADDLSPVITDAGLQLRLPGDTSTVVDDLDDLYTIDDEDFD